MLKTPGVDGKVITSRKPDDTPAFNQQILKMMTQTKTQTWQAQAI
jgi:putative intracellular protease/amidase